MIARLWFVLSLIWGGILFLNAATRVPFKFDVFDGVLIFGPFALGLGLRLAYRYIRFGP
jgi:hypothetical protein